MNVDQLCLNVISPPSLVLSVCNVLSNKAITNPISKMYETMLPVFADTHRSNAQKGQSTAGQIFSPPKQPTTPIAYPLSPQKTPRRRQNTFMTRVSKALPTTARWPMLQLKPTGGCTLKGVTMAVSPRELALRSQQGRDIFLRVATQPEKGRTTSSSARTKPG